MPLFTVCCPLHPTSSLCWTNEHRNKTRAAIQTECLRLGSKNVSPLSVLREAVTWAQNS